MVFIMKLQYWFYIIVIYVRICNYLWSKIRYSKWPPTNRCTSFSFSFYELLDLQIDCRIPGLIWYLLKIQFLDVLGSASNQIWELDWNWSKLITSRRIYKSQNCSSVQASEQSCSTTMWYPWFLLLLHMGLWYIHILSFLLHNFVEIEGGL